MVIDLRENGKTSKCKENVQLVLLMEIAIKVSFTKAKDKGMEPIHIIMEINIMVNGKMTLNKEMVEYQ